MKRSPIRPKRSTPRRKAPERVPARWAKASELTAEQRRYHAWLRERGACEACGMCRDLVIHHILARAPGKAWRRDHWFVVAIGAACHNGRADSVHGLGSEAAFARAFGIDLVAIAVERLEEWRDLDGN